MGFSFRLRVTGLAALVVGFLWQGAALAADADTYPAGGPPLRAALLRSPGNFDVRALSPSAPDAMAGYGVSTKAALAQRTTIAAKAIAALRAHSPGAQVRLSGVTATPELVSAGTNPLTAGGDADGRDLVRSFLREKSALYGLDAGEIDTLDVTAESRSASGLRMVRAQQSIAGRPVFLSEARFLFDAQGRLWRTVGALVPKAAASAAAAGEPALSAESGLTAALGSVGLDVGAASLRHLAPARKGQLLMTSSDPRIAGELSAELGWFPMVPGVVVPAWRYIVFTSGDADWDLIVDARSGAPLWRKDLRAHVSAHDARFRVYVQADGVTPADNPAPQSPNTAAPGAGTQFPAIAPTIVSMHTAYDPVSSPNGWIDDCPGGVCTAAQTQTVGNNVDACLDQVVGANASICDTAAGTVLDGNGKPTGNPDANSRNRDFLGTTPRDFQTNFLPPPQTTGADAEVGQTATGTGNNGTLAIDKFRRGSVTQLFYLVNWYHDRMYRFGFDEAAGNFQTTNFSGMGLGSDRVKAFAASGSGLNTSSFATGPDGSNSVLRLFRWTGPVIDRDGALDAEIAFHELTHGLTQRLVGNGAGLNWTPALAMGEGWSDFYALALLNNTNADNPNGQYAFGGYSSYKLAAAYTDNYVYGLRRFPYSTDNTVNPLTWADVDDVANDLSGGIAGDPLNRNANGALDINNAGEVWALSLWEVRSRVIADPTGANGDVPTGNTTTLQMVTDGLKMTPVNPTFTDARDALLAADCATNACANEASIWGGFADRGLGYGASAPYAILGRYLTPHIGIHTSFTVPFLDVVNPATDVTVDDTASNGNGAIDPNEAVRLSIKLTNPWRAAGKAVTGGAATLTSSTPGVVILKGIGTFGAIAPLGSATATGFAIVAGPDCGSSITLVLTTVSNLGTTSTTFIVRVGTRNGTDPVVTYSSDTTPVTIQDNRPRGVTKAFTITDDFEIADLDYRLDSATAPGVGDLTALLRSPGGIGTDLIALIDGLNDVGGTSISNMVIDDDVPRVAASDMVQAASANTPYSGSWSPVGNAPWAALVNPADPADPVGILSRFDGGSTLGTWTSLVADVFSSATGGSNGNGLFNGWSLLVTPVHFTCAAFTPTVIISATKSVAGGSAPPKFNVGDVAVYTIVLTNTGNSTQADNPGSELTDVLPAGLTLITAFASAGTTVANPGTNTVTWNGSLVPLGDTVTITISATVNASATSPVSNQATISVDSDADGDNDATSLTDDPSTVALLDPTKFELAIDPIPDAFFFAPVVDAPPSSLQVSNPITIQGINVAVPISVGGSPGALYSLNGGAFTGTTGNVVNGDTVRVAVTAATTGLTSTQATLVVGGVSGTFSVTTPQDPPTLNLVLIPLDHVEVGQTATLAWAATNADTCTASGAWSGDRPTGGNLVLTPSVAGDSRFALRCTGGGGEIERSVTLHVSAVTPPSISIALIPTSITVGGQSTLSWSSTHATACTSGGAWSGARPLAGVTSVSPAAAGTYTYTLTCSNQGTEQSASAVLVVDPVAPATPAPTVTIGVSPASIQAGGSATVTWSSTDAVSCTASGAWRGRRDPSGSLVVTPTQPGGSSFVLVCTGPGGRGIATTVLTVGTPPSTSLPTIAITVTPATVRTGEPVTVTWSTTDASTCSASGGWNGSVATSGTQSFTPTLAGTATYTLTCTGDGGSAAASSTATVEEGGGHHGGGGAFGPQVLIGLGLLAMLRRRVGRAALR